MEYILISLDEALHTPEMSSTIFEAIERFNIDIDQDVSNFLKYKAQEHNDINLSSTYLFLVEDDYYDYEILAYFTLVNNKVFSVKNANPEDRDIIFINDDNNNHQAAILIAQLGRNSKYDTSHINLTGILNEIFIKIKDIIKLGGGRFIILDCIDDHIIRYEEKGFTKINRNRTNGLNTFIMYSKKLV